MRRLHRLQQQRAREQRRVPVRQRVQRQERQRVRGRRRREPVHMPRTRQPASPDRLLPQPRRLQSVERNLILHLSLNLLDGFEAQLVEGLVQLVGNDGHQHGGVLIRDIERASPRRRSQGAAAARTGFGAGAGAAGARSVGRFGLLGPSRRRTCPSIRINNHQRDRSQTDGAQ